jgi:uncharacterized protein (TIGR02001 family)
LKGNILKKNKLGLLIALLLLATCGVALAEEDTKQEIETGLFAGKNFAASVALTTDYVYRGVSQTDENWAIQGSFDYGHSSGFYLGVWASNVDEIISEGNMEIDLYGGYSRELFKNFTFDIGVIYYWYPDPGTGPDRDFIEGVLGVKYAFSDIALSPELGLSYNYSPDFFGEDRDGNHLLGTLDLTLPYEFGIGGSLGYQDVQGGETSGGTAGEGGKSGFDYYYWRVGLSKAIKGFDLDLSYWDTDAEDYLGSYADSRVVFTLSRSF